MQLSLMEFPDRILDLGVRLRHLDLSSTHLTAFPKAFSAKLSALLELRISNNQLDASKKPSSLPLPSLPFASAIRFPIVSLCVCFFLYIFIFHDLNHALSFV